MSVRVEWSLARDARPTLYRRGDEVGDGVVTTPLAVGIGAQVFEGTRDDLLDLAGRLFAVALAAGKGYGT